MLSKREFLTRTTILAAGGAMPGLALAGTNRLPNLQAMVNEYIQTQRRIGRVGKDERTAWQISDLTTGKTLVAINADYALQAASMVKILVIQAYLFSHYKKDRYLYPLSERVMHQMREMVVHSNNEYTNHIMKRLGGPQGVQWILRKHAPHVFRQIKIVEYIPAGGRTYLNRASASDYDRFLRALWRNQLVGANQLLAMMGIRNHDRISVRTLVPKSATIYDKTGSTAMLCGNTGIIACRDRRGEMRAYNFTGIIERSNRTKQYVSWINDRSQLMREVSNIVYRYFASLYHLSS